MIQIPNYTIEKELGRGGMATVYLAMQDMLSRHVALKVMLPDMARDENFRKSFLSEGTIIASLEHANIVRIHDIGVIDDSVLYMAMEYLSGGTLKEQLVVGKLSFAESVKILEEVSQGLAYAHAKGYIHRDIKPGNILFRDDGTAVLTDFGIAKLQDTSGELTRLGFTMGTVQYMSPEQVITTDLDQRSDIYSLGLVFYEMLTGLKAFKAESTVQAIHQHTTVPPPVLPNEFAFLQSTMDKVLAKEPDKRFQSVADFVKAVTEVDDTDKTVIHRIETPVANVTDNDKTQIYQTGNTTPESKKEKRGFGLITSILGGLFIIGLGVFGALNYSEIDKRFEIGKYFSDKKQTVDDDYLAQDRLEQESLKKQAELEKNREKLEQQKALEKQEQQAKLEKQQAAEQQSLQDEIDQKKAEKAERIYQERLEQLQAEKIEKEHQDALTKQREEKKAQEQREALVQQRDEEAQKLQAELERQKEREFEQSLQAKRDQERENELLRETQRQQAAEIERKRIKEKALAKQREDEALAKKREQDKKRARDAERNKKKLATQRANEAARKKKELARKREADKKRKAAAIARKKAEAERRRKQQANARGQIRVSATLNRRPYKTSFIVTKNGKRVQTISGRSSANFSLPPGKYTVTTQYGGKVSRAVVNIGAYEIAEQRFVFSGRAAPPPRPPQPRAPANSKWTHSHEPAVQPRPATKKKLNLNLNHR